MILGGLLQKADDRAANSIPPPSERGKGIQREYFTTPEEFLTGTFVQIDIDIDIDISGTRWAGLGSAVPTPRAG